MGTVRLPDTIRRRLEKEGRLPPPTLSVGPDGLTRETRNIIRPRLALMAALERRGDGPGDLLEQCRRAGLPVPVREHVGIPGRRFRFDLAWPDRMVACEVDGGQFSIGEDGQQGGRHNRPEGFARDCEKLSLAAAHGWRVLRCTPGQVESGEALGWLGRALAYR